MDAYKRLKMFPDGWYRKLSKPEMEAARQQLKGYTLASQLETGIKEQMCAYNSYYVPFQELYLKMRKARKDNTPVTPELLLEWEELMKESDKASRERLYVLTVAAEMGWTVAADVASGIKGDYADKNLVRAIKRKDKRETEKTKEKAKVRKPYGGYRGPPRPPQYPAYQPYGYYPYGPAASGAPPAPHAGGYGQRPDPKICSYCRQHGHCYRQCPLRPAPSAALGAPPPPPPKGGLLVVKNQPAAAEVHAPIPSFVEKFEEPRIITNDVSFNKFTPGLIHQPRFFDYWKDVLLAPEWVLNQLKSGYSLPLKDWPPQYEEDNNKSARDNMSVVRSILADMILQGVVYVVRQRPQVVSPLGLVSNKLEDGSFKHRLVYDASRHLNQYLEIPHVRLSHLEKALELTRPNDFQVIFDLTSAYYHIKIREDQHTLLGAAFTNSDGSKIYIQYAHLPFGIASAVHAITKIWKPVSQYLNQAGVRNTVYIDDGRLLGDSKATAEQARITAFEVITKAGWAIEASKSDGPLESNTRKAYLGFVIDTQTMVVEAKTTKLLKVRKLLTEALNMEVIPVKRLASLAGNIISLEPSHGMLARITTRSSYMAIAEHTELYGWRGSLVRTLAMTNELRFFLRNIDGHNGSPIKNKQLEFRIENLLTNPIARQHVIPNHQEGSHVYVSDSSDSKMFVYDLRNNNKTEMVANFDQTQKGLSSGGRELLAVLWTLRQWQAQKTMTNTGIYWVTDSENVCSFLKKGSRKPDIQTIVFEITNLASRMGITIEPIHLLREDPRIQLADDGSKRADSDDWSVDIATIMELKHQYPVQIDLFASTHNKVVDAYCSLYYEPTAIAIDAFSISWSQFKFVWICPPVALLIRVHKKILESTTAGLIILPIWKTSSFYSFFFTTGCESRHPFKTVKVWHPYIVQHENARNTALFGQVPFKFAALFFDLS